MLFPRNPAPVFVAPKLPKVRVAFSFRRLHRTEKIFSPIPVFRMGDSIRLKVLGEEWGGVEGEGEPF